jgi:gluconate 2-dehydrogenase gamma chain
MTRRGFLGVSTAIGLSVSMKAESVNPKQKEIEKVLPVITAVQAHMFPEGSKLPSAKEMKMNTFLVDTIFHPSYDKDIRAFVINGAEDLDKRTKGKFIQMDSLAKEEALRSYEETNYGSNWLSRIMTLSMEALFSDPIYGSNIKEAGWKAVDSYGGEPRPKQRYIEL